MNNKKYFLLIGAALVVIIVVFSGNKKSSDTFVGVSPTPTPTSVLTPSISPKQAGSQQATPSVKAGITPTPGINIQQSKTYKDWIDEFDPTNRYLVLEGEFEQKS